MNTTTYNQFAKEIANYINYHCDGVDEGFEIEYEGFTAFVSYKAEIRGCRGLLDGSELDNREREYDGSGRMG